MSWIAAGCCDRLNQVVIFCTVERRVGRAETTKARLG